jgi:RimJ/RimL family protein N-acetyltransferase
MTSALRVYVNHVFNDFEIIRLTAYTLDFNIASVTVLEKTGFVLEGCLRKHTRTRNGLFDTFVYGLLKEEFKYQ